MKEWLAQFSGEFYGASIDVVKDKSRPYKTAIHKDMKQVKKARDANNWRNNDVYGANRANGLLFDVQDPLDNKDGWYITNKDLTEMSLITSIDERQDQEALTLVEYLSCRAVMAPERVPALDQYFRATFELCIDEWEKLLCGYINKKISVRKLEVALELGKLKELIVRVKI